jgi:hypothetical protein
MRNKAEKEEVTYFSRLMFKVTPKGDVEISQVDKERVK